MNLIEIQRNRIALLRELKERQGVFQQEKDRIEKECAKLDELESLNLGGIDAGKIELGRSVLAICGTPGKCVNGTYSDQKRKGLRSKMVDEAIVDLVSGLPTLRHEYFGIKNYSGFGDQRQDCQYGMGPRHGDIVFSIGLNRNRLKDEFTEEEIEAAVYLLRNLGKAQEAKAA